MDEWQSYNKHCVNHVLPGGKGGEKDWGMEDLTASGRERGGGLRDVRSGWSDCRLFEETQTHSKSQLCMTVTYSTTVKIGWNKIMIIARKHGGNGKNSHLEINIYWNLTPYWIWSVLSTSKIKRVAVGDWVLTHGAVQEVGEFGQIRLILLKVVEAVDMLKIHIQLSEVFGEDTRPWVQDAPKIGLGQLLPLVQSHWACGQWQDEVNGSIKCSVLSRKYIILI